jgi:hypothetical protein
MQRRNAKPFYANERYENGWWYHARSKRRHYGIGSRIKKAFKKAVNTVKEVAPVAQAIAVMYLIHYQPLHKCTLQLDTLGLGGKDYRGLQMELLLLQELWWNRWN